MRTGSLVLARSKVDAAHLIVAVSANRVEDIVESKVSTNPRIGSPAAGNEVHRVGTAERELLVQSVN